MKTTARHVTITLLKNRYKKKILKVGGKRTYYVQRNKNNNRLLLRNYATSHTLMKHHLLNAKRQIQVNLEFYTQ